MRLCRAVRPEWAGHGRGMADPAVASPLFISLPLCSRRLLRLVVAKRTAFLAVVTRQVDECTSGQRERKQEPTPEAEAEISRLAVQEARPAKAASLSSVAAIKGRPCFVENETYDNGETFMLDCRTQCTCQVRLHTQRVIAAREFRRVLPGNPTLIDTTPVYLGRSASRRRRRLCLHHSTSIAAPRSASAVT